MPYRAYHVVQGAGIRLAELVAAGGYSRSTWSRFLRAELDPEPEGARAVVERVLREHGSTPRGLWQRMDDHQGGGDPPETTEGEITMQAQSLSQAAQRTWGLFMSPFDMGALIDPEGGDRLGDLHLTMEQRFIEQRMIQVLTHMGFFALSGPAGAGKSTLLERAVRTAGELHTITLVRPANVERRKLTAVHISAEIIRQLSSEPVPRTANARDAVATEVLRHRYSLQERVCLVIDEAHELPSTTVIDLKRYHELRDGYARLLGIILVGREELAARFSDNANFRLREVILRCELKRMGAMTGEVGRYLAKRFTWVGRSVDEVWDEAAVQTLERRLGVKDQALPLVINNAATAAMNIAARRGNARVTEDDVETVWASSAELLQEVGL